jgi:uncharacterized integral membrane protein (TIGR00698 family)
VLSPSRFVEILPGLGAAVAVSLAAWAVEWAESAVLGAPYLDALVLAIVGGTLLHTVFGLAPRLLAGVRFAAKTVLEVAIVLLGGTISAQAVVASGSAMVGVVALVVMLALALSYGMARLLGLDERLATLVACGNSICGNSAIMATAPVIEAPAGDVAAAISFTAALGVVVVVLLPLAFGPLGLSQWQFGVVAGLSVYAVPQVLAATAPVGAMAAQVGTLVKLMRVLMLGPVVLLVGLRRGRGARLPLATLVPWFIVGFVLMMVARSAGVVPEAVVPALRSGSGALTLVSMAALGLSVDLRSVLASGGRVLLAGVLSIGVLLGLALATALLLAN